MERRLKNSPAVLDLLRYKDLYKQSEEERKQLAQDYTHLVKKFNVVEKENANLRKENERLRKLVDERKGES